MPLLDYTTTVPVSRTVAQVQAKLVEHGARAVMMEYDGQGRGWRRCVQCGAQVPPDSGYRKGKKQE